MKGYAKKLKSELKDPVEYQLPLGDELLPLNDCLGKAVRIEFSGNIRCLNCSRPTKKSYSQGYCYPCMKKLARCDMCIMKPETCHYAAGTCREPEWGEANCMIDHYVYLANSSGLKVGITRHTQVPTRWIDQGAVQALPVYKVSTRLDSGRLETTLASMISDKTNWRAMLKGDVVDIDLKQCRDELLEGLSADLLVLQSDGLQMQLLDEEPIAINYPVLRHPVKVSSFNLDKDPVIEGTLEGIKGQYLMFDTGVVNIRKYTSYELEVSVDG